MAFIIYVRSWKWSNLEVGSLSNESIDDEWHDGDDEWVLCDINKCLCLPKAELNTKTQPNGGVHGLPR